MPQVPRYGDGRQVATAPLPNVRWDPTIPREAVAAVPHLNLEPAARDVQDIFEREKQKADQVAVTSAEARAAALETDISDGVAKMQGVNAMHARDYMNEQWQKGMGEINKDLHNDTQRMAFQRASILRYEGLNRSTTQHIRTQTEAHDDNETQKLVENETNAVVAAAVKGVAFKDLGDRASDGIAKIKHNLVDYANRKGLTPPQVQALMDTQISHVHALLLERMLANDDDITASRWLGVFKDELKGQDLINAEKAVDEGSTRGESQRKSDDIVSRHPNDPDGAMEEVKKIQDPKVRDATQARVEHEFDKKKALQRDKEDALYLSATNLIEPYVKSGRPFVASQVIPSNVWSQLPIPMRTALERRALHADSDYPNNPYKWHDFLELDPKVLGKMNRSEFESQYWQFADRETRFREELMWRNATDMVKSGKNDPKISADMSFTQLTKDALQKMDPKYRTKQAKDWDKDRADFYTNFTVEAMRRKEEAEHAKGKPIDRAEMQGIIDSLTTERVFINRGMFHHDAQALAGEVSKDAQGDAYVPLDAIPTKYRNELEQMVRNAHKSPSRRLIEQLYAARKMNNKELFNSLLGAQ